MLKLHGSVNWRPKLGHADPPPLDAITHHDSWSALDSTMVSSVADHLEAQPVMVPPVLSKMEPGGTAGPPPRLVASIHGAPIRSRGYILGHSFPTTDMAARTLFSEALKGLPREDIHVVNLASSQTLPVCALLTVPRSGTLPMPNFISGALSNMIRSQDPSGQHPEEQRRSKPVQVIVCTSSMLTESGP